MADEETNTDEKPAPKKSKKAAKPAEKIRSYTDVRERNKRAKA